MLNTHVTELDDSRRAGRPEAGASPAAEIAAADMVTISQGGAETVTAREVEIQQGGAVFVTTGELRVAQGGVLAVRAESASLEQGGIGIAVADNLTLTDAGAGVVVGRHITAIRSRSLVLLAQSVGGEVETVLDTRGALLAGLGAGAVVGLALLIGALLRRKA